MELYSSVIMALIIYQQFNHIGGKANCGLKIITSLLIIAHLERTLSFISCRCTLVHNWWSFTITADSLSRVSCGCTSRPMVIPWSGDKKKSSIAILLPKQPYSLRNISKDIWINNWVMKQACVTESLPEGAGGALNAVRHIRGFKSSAHISVEPCKI